MSSRAQRAERRRREWSESVVDGQMPKGPLYADLSPVQRLHAYAELNRRAWLATGGSIEQLPRSEWPGEIIDLNQR